MIFERNRFEWLALRFLSNEPNKNRRDHFSAFFTWIIRSYSMILCFAKSRGKFHIVCCGVETLLGQILFWNDEKW